MIKRPTSSIESYIKRIVIYKHEPKHHHGYIVKSFHCLDITTSHIGCLTSTKHHPEGQHQGSIKYGRNEQKIHDVLKGCHDDSNNRAKFFKHSQELVKLDPYQYGSEPAHSNDNRKTKHFCVISVAKSKVSEISNCACIISIFA